MMGMEIMRTKFAGSVAPLVLALLAALIGAGYQHATFHPETSVDSFATAASAADAGPAELDPAFTQRLADRMRGPYERSR
jgi:hypothetical protein